jgi:ABC-type multidrug transport system permease subunit
MSIQNTTNVIYKGVWRDIKSYFRYPAYFLGMFLELVSLTLGFAIIGGAYYFTPEVLSYIGLNESDLFVFMLTGALIQVFSGIATWGPYNRVYEDVHYGTVDAIFVSPTSRMGYLVASAISRGLMNIFFFIPLYILTLILTGTIVNFAIIGFTLLVIVITFISNVTVGLFFGMFALLTRQARIFVSMTNQLIQFLFGAYLPVQSFMVINRTFGTVMKYFTFIFPYTYNFDLIRHFFFGDRFITLLPIWLELVILGANVIFYLGLARVMLIFVERKAKEQGLAIL